MPNITATAKQFFDACETGKGWAGCREYCTPNASFSAQAEPLANVKTLKEYTDWMKGLLTFIPDGRYEDKSFATDDDRKSVCAYGIFSGTHTGEGGPCPPTGKRTDTELRLFHGVRGRQNPPHDEDLERWMGDEGSRLGCLITSACETVGGLTQIGAVAHQTARHDEFSPCVGREYPVIGC